MKRVILLLLILLVLLCGCSSKEPVRHHNPDKIIIALLDTGVSAEAIISEHLLKGYNYVTETTDTEDLINHGTAVASTILGCESASVTGGAPDAYIVPLVIVTKCDGEITSVSGETLARAIRESVDVYNADIINVSLGIQKNNDVLYEAVVYANEKGVAVIAAIGNDGEEGKPYYPAAYDIVLSVGSCDKNGKKSDFTQNGADVLAPGEDILLASRNGVPYGIRGTSLATGFVSAYAANLIMANPDIVPEELFDKIIKAKVVFVPPVS